MRKSSPRSVVGMLRGPWEWKVVEDIGRIVDSDGDIVCTPKKSTLLQGEAILHLPEAMAIVCEVARGGSGKRGAKRLLAELYKSAPVSMEKILEARPLSRRGDRRAKKRRTR